jgi:hypothetical protein
MTNYELAEMLVKIQRNTVKRVISHEEARALAEIEKRLRVPVVTQHSISKVYTDRAEAALRMRDSAKSVTEAMTYNDVHERNMLEASIWSELDDKTFGYLTYDY